MDYINYIYEAIFFFNQINNCIEKRFPRLMNQERMNQIGINQSIYTSIMRIIVVNDLIDYDENDYILTDEQYEKHKVILDSINQNNQSNHYSKLYAKAVNKSQFFFDSINELEYEIYSRYNYSITFEVGKKVAEYINFNHQRILELGGNSGGFGTAILTKNKECQYSVVDKRIPCMVGNEIKEINKTNITFIEGDVFELKLPYAVYDYIIIMNLLHDFDDINCLMILKNCKKYCDTNTKIIVIEDILTSEFKPKEAIIHGMRLSIECRGGKQRTIKEFEQLFLGLDYKPDKIIHLSETYIMLIAGSL